MKHLVFFLAMLIGLLMLISGCKKQYRCEHGYYCLPVNISFVGFLPEDLDTLVLKTYTQENGALRLIATDTSYHMPVWLSDTAYRDIDSNNHCYGFYSFSELSTSYTILLPGTGDSFIVSDIQPQKNAVWEQDNPCSAHGTFISPFRCTVTGTHTDIYQPGTNNYFIGLMKP